MNWYAIYIKPKCEDSTSLQFRNAGIGVLNPKMRIKKYVRGKYVTTIEPLFPGYLFACFIHETYPMAWKQWSKSAGIELPGNSKATRLDSMIAVVRACERGLGAALVPVPLADLWFKYGSIVRLFSQQLVTEASYYLVVREDRARDPAVSLLQDWILRNFREPD